jgi:signal transduction histidine kinase
MTARTASRLAWTIWALSIVLGVVAAWLNVVNARTASGVLAIHVFLVPGYATIGAIVAARTGNRIGWLFLAVGLASAGTAFTFEYSVRAMGTAPGSLPFGSQMGAVQNIGFPTAFMWIGGLMLLFPDGHLPSRRWRPVAWAFAIVWGAIAIWSLVNPAPIEVGDFRFPNPFAIQATERLSVFPYQGATATVIWTFASWGLLVAVVSAPFFRRRRAAPEEREQLRWIAFAVMFLLASGLVAVVATVVAPNVGAWLAVVPVVMIAFGIPLAVGLAILKYRLFDIDVVINKAVVFGALAAFITIVYVSIVVGLGALIGSGAQNNPALAIAATAIVAVAFQPVRERVQRFANRLVYGERATPYQVLAEFSERVAGTYATEDVLPRTARVLAEGTGAARSEIWLRIGQSLQLAAAWPQMNGGPAARVPMPSDGLPVLEGVDRAVAVRHGDEMLGVIAVRKPAGEPLSPAEGRLLDDLAAQAGLVLSNVRLTAELEARLDRIAGQAAELRTSRQRIVTAQDAERQRLERNIHDGAQQHLVALAVKLRLAKGLIRKDPTKARAMLTEIRQETGEAIDTLTDLSRGIYPALLEEQGIAAALAAQYTRSTIPVSLSSDGIRRYPIETEAAIYFCCLEALQNAAKYAAAGSVRIELREVDSAVEFEVRDDGPGFDPAATPRGTGLNSLADRLSVLGGDVTIESEPGEGTVVRGRLPIGAAQVHR